METTYTEEPQDVSELRKAHRVQYQIWMKWKYLESIAYRAKRDLFVGSFADFAALKKSHLEKVRKMHDQLCGALVEQINNHPHNRKYEQSEGK